MLTPSFSITATERVLPRLALDFTTNVLDARITFTRTTNATRTASYVDSAGLIVYATDNQPRFDHVPATLVRRGLLLEEARTNTIYNTTNLTTTGWITPATFATVTNNVAVSPDGTQNAALLAEDNTNNQHYLRASSITNIPANTTLTTSFFAKAAGRSTVIVTQNGSSTFRASFNLSTVSASAVSGSATITNFGNGWYRCTHTCTPTFNAAPYIHINNYFAYQGDGTSGLYIWGVQHEVGSFASSYIPNTTSTGSMTRDPDVAVMTGTNFSSWWNATTGAAAIRAQQNNVAGIAPWLQFDDTTANNLIVFRGNTTNPELYIKATTDQAQIDAGTIAAATNYGLAGAWNTDNCAASLNGAAAVTDTSATIPTVTQARLGSDGTNYLNGWLQSVRYWPQRIINAETQAFSKL